MARVPFILVVLSLLVGCGGDNTESAAEELTFNVVDSLLGPVLVIESSGLSFRPPATCPSAPDSIQTALRQQLSLNVTEGQTVNVEGCFVDLDRLAGVMACTITGIDFSSDSTNFLSNYRQSLIDQFGSKQVMQGAYTVGGVRVESFRVTSPQLVQFKLICWGKGTVVTELSYFAAVSEYERFVKLIESSIGSIKLMEGGDVS